MLGMIFKAASVRQALNSNLPFLADSRRANAYAILHAKHFSAGALSRQSHDVAWLRVPPKIYFKAGCLEVAMADFASKKRVFIVTDKPLFDLGVSNKVTSLLDAMQIQHKIYYHVEPEPDLKMVLEGARFAYLYTCLFNSVETSKFKFLSEEHKFFIKYSLDCRTERDSKLSARFDYWTWWRLADGCS
jgi:hypothetical protein